MEQQQQPLHFPLMGVARVHPIRVAAISTLTFSAGPWLQRDLLLYTSSHNPHPAPNLCRQDTPSREISSRILKCFFKMYSRLYPSPHPPPNLLLQSLPPQVSNPSADAINQATLHLFKVPLHLSCSFLEPCLCIRYLPTH